MPDRPDQGVPPATPDPDQSVAAAPSAAVTSMVWPVPRSTVIPRAAGERAMLAAYLEHYRETLELKCTGAPAGRLSERSCPPSTMSLHGLVRHLAGVERWWFQVQFAGHDVPLLYYSDDDPNQDFESLDGDVDEAFGVWHRECARSREIGADASLDDTGVAKRDGQSFSLRWLLVNMIAEYARHNGHADLLRERLDGATGA